MTTIRIQTIILFLIFFSVTTVGQKSIATKELEIIADKYSVDSALNTVKSFTDIFKIDPSIALSIALKCSDLNEYSRQFTYFMSVGQIIKNETINSIATNRLKNYRGLFSDSVNKSYKYFVIPDQVFHVLAFQNDISIITTLKAEFNYWELKADSIRNLYPSKTKRFFQRFKGIPICEQLFSECKENCYKLAWTLNKLGDSNFSFEKANVIRQQLVPYLRDYDMERLKFKFYEGKCDTLQLNKSYSSIEEIDFDNELELVKLKENLEGNKCWKQIVTNSKAGLYEIGCQWAPLAGRGKTIRLELIGCNKLQVTVINAWLS